MVTPGAHARKPKIDRTACAFPVVFPKAGEWQVTGGGRSTGTMRHSAGPVMKAPLDCLRS